MRVRVCDADEAPAHTDRTASLDANPLLRPEHCDSEYAISPPQCQADIVAEFRAEIMPRISGAQS
jgi:hypothetical protein